MHERRLIHNRMHYLKMFSPLHCEWALVYNTLRGRTSWGKEHMTVFAFKMKKFTEDGEYIPFSPKWPFLLCRLQLQDFAIKHNGMEGKKMSLFWCSFHRNESRYTENDVIQYWCHRAAWLCSSRKTQNPAFNLSEAIGWSQNKRETSSLKTNEVVH